MAYKSEVTFRYIANHVRGVSVYFGEDTVIHMCQLLDVSLIVRAHQVSPMITIMQNVCVF